MIREVSGDILLSRANVVAHGVAPNDHYDNGLALSLRERWPAMAKDFRHYCHANEPKAGGIWAWAGADGRRIVSLLTQEAVTHHGSHKGGRAQLSHVNHSLKELRRFIEAERVTSVALPRLATGVGGLEWKDVQPLIRQHLGDLSIPVFIYSTFKAGVAADEGH
jgi:O-acetyl-ADP-ribose deacetylase (regulator of RNase III)